MTISNILINIYIESEHQDGNNLKNLENVDWLLNKLPTNIHELKVQPREPQKHELLLSIASHFNVKKSS